MNLLYFVFFICNLSFIHDIWLYYVIVAACTVTNLVSQLFKLLTQRKGEKTKSGISINDVRGIASTFKLFRSDNSKK
jgi:hypothetical protein